MSATRAIRPPLLSGTVTLDAQGSSDAEFIFQTGSTLIAESNSRVVLINGADPCHVVWQVGSSATFKTGTQFVGDVLALMSITAQTGATFQGRLLAQNGAVTLDNTTITNANCAASGGTTSTTVGTTSTTIGTTTTSTTPPVAPDSISPGIGPAITAGTPGAASAPPSGTPGAPSAGIPGVPSRGAPSTPSTPPSLARTGVQILGLMGASLALLALGASAALTGRRSRKRQTAS